MYKKRPGTSGIRGQLFESKLLSLIYFRAKHDDSIDKIYLATNVDKVGAFDDICFKAKVKGFDKPVVVFIQAKHKETAKIVTLNCKNDLAKYFESYLKIRREFKPSNKDVLFNGNFNESECLFVIYTNAKDDLTNTKYKGTFASYLDDLICTGDPGLQPFYENKTDVNFLCETVMREEITTLAEHMEKFIFNKADCVVQMNDELVLRYHVILAQHVFEISAIQPEGHRIATFRNSFFDSNNDFLKLFKDALIADELKRLQIQRNLITDFFSKIYSVTNVIRTQKHSNDAKEILRKRVLKVSHLFGNFDLALRGSDEKIENRLNHLTSRFHDLLKKSNSNNIVTIDDSLEAGFLRLNGGIASAIGNILVPDENPKLLKFTDDCESLESLARRLYDKLKIKIPNLGIHKFDVKTQHFPKLSFTHSDNDEILTKDFLNNLLFYTNQADELKVEGILKKEIEDNHYHEMNNFRVRSAAVFLKYHDSIQKWWMIPEKGSYLTKESKIYENALTDTINEPLINVINIMYTIRNQDTDCTFNEDALNSLNLQEKSSGTVIVTESSTLTVAKVKQYLKNKDVFVIDFEYIINLPTKDHKTLHTELKNMNEDKILILVCNKYQNTKSCCKILENITSINNKNIVIVTDEQSVAIVKQYFLRADLVNDAKNRLIDMSYEFQKNILQKTRVLFQGNDINLNIMQDHAVNTLIEGEVLRNIILNGKIIIGKSVGKTNYDKIKHLYISRRLYPNELEPDAAYDDHKVAIRTLHDIKDDVVVIIAKSGMGKSTLLSHLSIKTKECNPAVWIIRIDLLDYSNVFRKWQKDKTVIDTIESLKFMCQAALSEHQSKINEIEITLEESNGVVYLKDCTGDEWTVFELKMFLHFYNRIKLIFLFDGFDEICPHYVHEVMALLKIVNKYPKKHKMWITSRSYDKINDMLLQQFNKFYEIEDFSSTEQDLYLHNFWTTICLEDLNDDQIQNIYDFIMFVSKNDKILMLLKKKEISPTGSDKERSYLGFYLSFIRYLKSELKGAPYLVKKALDTLAYDKNLKCLDGIVTTPLHLYLMAENFYKEIKDVNKNPNKWDIDNDILNIYDSFIDLKLKEIRFEQKNEIDLSKPDNDLTYEKERADVITKHKKLAAYAIFYQNHDKLFNTKELNEVTDMIEILKEGKEKTGIVCNVANDIPVFVHSTIAEYYAVEFICDLLKSNRRKGKQKSIWDFVLNVMFFHCNFNILYTFDVKIRDSEELFTVVEQTKDIIFELLLEQSTEVDNYSELKSSLCEATRYGLRNFTGMLLSTLKNNLDENNLEDFIKIVTKTNMFIIAVKMEFEELIITVVDHVKRIDVTKLSMLFENLEDFEMSGLLSVSTDEVVRELHRHVWTRMGIVPEWTNLAEFSGQIHFI